MAQALYKAPAVNFGSTSLNGAINSSVDTITLNSTSNLKSPGYVVIDRQDNNTPPTNTPNAREVVSYTGISGNDLTGCTRGADGSTQRSHSDGALVEPVLTIGMWNDQQDFLAVSLSTVDGSLRAMSSASIVTLNNSFIMNTSGASISILTGTSLYYSNVTLTNLTITNSALASGASIVGFFPSGASGAVLTSRGNSLTPVYSTSGSVIAPNSVVTNDAAGTVTTSGTTPLTIISKTITNPSSAGQILITAQFNLASFSVANDEFKIYLLGPDGNEKVDASIIVDATTERTTATLNWQGAVAASGTQTLTMAAVRVAGTGTVSFENGRQALTWTIFQGAGTTA